MRETRETSSSRFFEQVRPEIEIALLDSLPPASQSPERLHEAMRYSVLAGGKRLRPMLCTAGYATFSPDWPRVVPVAVSLELIHTYSLIHDDLPAMDDDDFRRGLPSCHRRFGEALAILAGDGLLTLAFESLVQAPDFSAEQLLNVTLTLAKAAGTSGGMIGGQVLDLGAQGNQLDPTALESIHRSKTGALLEASLDIGAYLSGATLVEIRHVQDYGRHLGLSYQIIDDILDEVAPVDQLGKTPGKDRAQSKATYPGLLGVDRSRQIVRQLTAKARDALQPLGSKADLLVDIADHLERRSN